MIKKVLYTFIFSLMISNCLIGQQFIQTNKASIDFVSEAPLELIKASTNKCQGILDLENGDFAFRVKIEAFDGFNSPLQKEHFFENYMESNNFPEATFVGKMVENLNPENLKQAPYRAKGILDIHGIKVERIIPIQLNREADGLYFESEFLVALKDHGIDIPTIVKQKIAEKIKVKVSGTLE